MIRALNAHVVVSGEATYFEYAGLSTDTKPTRNDIATGSIFMEVDTGDAYFYDEDGSQWIKAGGGNE